MSGGEFVVRAGVVADDTNRESGSTSPVFRVEWRPKPRGGEPTSIYFDWARSTQVPSYTALNSNPSSGLFRGNPNLGRAVSRNAEVGVTAGLAGWRTQAAAFHRQDRDLVDWTYRNGVTARTANPIDVDTTGLEVVARRRSARCDVTVGYAFLCKDADYGTSAVDASFYAMNFARHRLTAAFVVRLGRGLELRVDDEFRVQEPNFLRKVGGDNVWLASAGLYFMPTRWRGLELSLSVDNLWDSRFQEVPAVPATPRQLSGGMTWRW